MKASPAKVGVIGCGNISGIYFTNMKKMETLEVAACADLIMERAESSAKQHGIPKACTPAELLADPSIEMVVNLTIPKAHAEVALAAVEAGKSVYTEKPLAVTREDGQRIVERAAEKGVLVGCAPDTFLGAGIQTCVRLINDGVIGAPVAATAFMTCHGHEGWHPDPAFYYQSGGGPVFDMGPYYFTALIALMGPARRVSGSVSRSFPRRVVGSGPREGQVIEVEVPTHAAGTIDFEAGAIASFVMSFDIWHAELPRIEIYGTEGSLSVPDPNGFGGPVRVRASRDAAWQDVPVTLPHAENSRGLGVSEMVEAIGAGRPPRASGALGLHALEIMHAVHDASGSERYVNLRWPAARPAALE